MSASVHPAAALFKGEKPFPIIPSCDQHDRATYRYLLGSAAENQIHRRAGCGRGGPGVFRVAPGRGGVVRATFANAG
jgi:hypothetical protein